MFDEKASYNPVLQLGELFVDIAISGIIADGKIWVDASPLFPVAKILEAYENLRYNVDFDLFKFVQDHFELHEENDLSGFATVSTDSTRQHVERLWPVLTKSDKNLSNLGTKITLPFPYVVPGGRFKEIYYWDSYFTMLGLKISGEWKLIENMIKNFAWMIDQFGFIPNGSRSYYLSRSQPPFFSLMVTLLASKLGKDVLLEYLPQLKKEYRFWTDPNQKRIHESSDGFLFVTYYDELDLPREEMMQSDLEIYRNIHNRKEDFFRNIRAACESGWDFSSRWFENGFTMDSMQTLHVAPIDLECLLWHLENTLADACRVGRNQEESEYFEELAARRKQKINQYFWDEEAEFYCDVKLPLLEKSKNISLAGFYPLFFNLSDQLIANKVLATLEKKFLKVGGLVTTTAHTGQQWDAPNGWAPLQWIGFISCINYGQMTLANTIRERWLGLNDAVFRKTGKMLEKYNVEDLDLEGGGGEYPVQDGFGWTNGVYLALSSEESYL